MYCNQCGAEIPFGQDHCVRCVSQAYSPAAFRPLYASRIDPIYPSGSFRYLYFGYIASWLLYFFLDILKDVGKALMTSNPPDESIAFLFVAGLVLSLIAFAVSIANIVYWAYLLFRCWALVQDSGRARVTPGQAVGYCFIPVFNFYWFFVAQLGLADEMNDYIRRRGIVAPSVGRGIATASSLMLPLAIAFVFALVGLVMIATMLNPERFQENSTVWTLSVGACASVVVLARIVIDAILYRQFAETAEAIQQYKIRPFPPNSPTPNSPTFSS